MRYVSLFSGIEAASVAWHPLGWTPVAFAEIEPFPSAVLAHHYPDVPNLGDVTKVDWHEFARANGPIDLVVFGSPCQSFSVAGKRLGLDDPRGNLAIFALGIINILRPQWFIFENVPGLLSSGEGRDFGAFLGTISELGDYGAAWKILDAQFVRVESHPRAVPQRRRRVFVVGNLGSWQRAAAVLFERESLSGHSPPSRKAGEGTTRDIAPSLRGRSNASHRHDTEEYVASTGDIAHCLNAGGMGRIDYETETMVAEVAGTMKAIAESGGWSNSADHAAAGYMVPVAFDMRGREGGAQFEGPHDTANIRAASGGSSKSYVAQAIPFDSGQITSKYNYSVPKPGDPCHPLAATAHVPAIATQFAVRRLTPEECEKLQGFPPGYTAVPYRGKIAADGPRYKALGNSMAVNCMRWLGERIESVHAMQKALAA